MPTGLRMTETEMIDAAVCFLNNGNFKTAGRELDLTAAGVSLRIQKLEETRGLMFERKHEIRLPIATEHGREFLNSAGWFQNDNGVWLKKCYD